MTLAPPGRAMSLAVVVLVLSSCSSLPGGDSDFVEQGPRAIAKAAFKEMRDVESLRMLGSVDTDDDGIARVDLRLDGRGNCTGSMTFDAGTLRVVRNDMGAWFTADERYWRSLASSPAQEAQLMATLRGSWVQLEEDDDVAELCDLQRLLDSFRLTKQDTADTLSKGEVEQVGETDAIAITGRNGKESVTAWVSVEAPHHVLKVAPANDTGELEELFLEEFDRLVVADSPPKRDIVDLAALGG